MEKITSILLVEDNEAHTELISRSFEKFENYKITWVNTFSKAEQYLQNNTPAIIISDWRLPDGEGINLLTSKINKTQIPIVLMTSFGSEILAVEAMKAGVLDYIVKSPETLRDLPQTISRSLRDWENINARKQAEIALKESQKKYMDLIEHLPQSVFEADTNGKLIFANTHLLNSFGFTHKDFAKGINVITMIDPSNHEKATSKLHNIINNNDTNSIDLLMLKTNTTTFPSVLYPTIIKNSDLVEGIRGIIVDVTEQKIIEDKIKLNEIRLEAMLSLSKMSDKSIKIITDFALKKAVEITKSDIGYLAFVEENKTIHNIFSWSNTMKECLVQNFQQNNNLYPKEFLIEAIKQQKPIVANTYKLVVSEDIEVKRHMNVPLIDGENVVLIIGVANKIDNYDESDIQQITLLIDGLWKIVKRKKAEEILQQSEKRFRELADLLPETIYETDENGIFTFVNKTGLETFGYTIEDLLQKPNILDFIHPNDHQKAISNRHLTINQNKTIPVEYESIKKDGTIIPVIIHTAPIIIDNKITGTRGIVINISERKKYEQELKEAKSKAEESDRLKSTFLANMSHEIRTPLNGIMGFASLLKMASELTEKQKTYLEIIDKNGNTLLNLINDIVDISKIEAGQMKIINSECNLNDLLFDLFNFFQSLKIDSNSPSVKIKIHSSLSNNNSTILVDEFRLRQIFTNLIGNALKFTQKGSIDFGYSITNNIIDFFVKDTGIGIAKEHQRLIFERFRQADDSNTRKYGGTGLGLAITKQIVELMDGEISVYSQLGEGTIFSFKLPYKPVKSTKIDNRSQIINYNWSNKKILVVEDIDDIFNYLKIILKPTKIKIVHAKTGVKAIDICERTSDFDLILMDIQLPKLNGYDATKAIKLILPNLPIIAQTAHAFSEDKAKCLSAGCDDFISKPIDQKILIEKMARFLN